MLKMLVAYVIKGWENHKDKEWSFFSAFQKKPQSNYVTKHSETDIVWFVVLNKFYGCHRNDYNLNWILIENRHIHVL